MASRVGGQEAERPRDLQRGGKELDCNASHRARPTLSMSLRIGGVEAEARTRRLAEFRHGSNRSRSPTRLDGAVAVEFSAAIRRRYHSGACRSRRMTERGVPARPESGSTWLRASSRPSATLRRDASIGVGLPEQEPHRRRQHDAPPLRRPNHHDAGQAPSAARSGVWQRDEVSRCRVGEQRHASQHTPCASHEDGGAESGRSPAFPGQTGRSAGSQSPCARGCVQFCCGSRAVSSSCMDWPRRIPRLLEARRY